ncbi:MAG: M18 family aminopeptidase [Myxococcota bacterium]
MTDAADDLLHFIAASPTPFHATAEAARRLEAAGYRRLEEAEPWALAPGERVYVVRGESTLGAFELGTDPPSEAGVHLVGAHTDSPNLRIKPQPQLEAEGYHQLAVEVYGGVLLHTWLDRDLSMAGRVALRSHGAGVRTALVDFGRALLRIPSLAIHLDRSVNQEGLKVDPQKHLAPVLALAADGPRDLRHMLAAQLGDTSPEDILGWDLCLHDVQPPARCGPDGEMLLAPRLDNLASCHAALQGLLLAGGERERTRGIVLYDHEEVGSRSARGAASPFLRTVLERLVRALTPESGDDGFARAMACSFVVSADMAHAVHPNHADRHDPQHRPLLGRGPVLKVHTSQAYASDAEGWGRFEALCRAADVTPQRFVSRNDLPCGSTIGPITAAELGVPTVDVGNPMLSMHSCREMAAAADHPKMISVLRRFFES